jgi:sulfatase modifying factor 1
MSTEQKIPTGDALIFPLPDLELVLVEGLPEGATFEMGGARYEFEQPIHDVRIGYSFYLCRFQVTQQLYEQVMGKNPSNFKGKRRPVETVSWDDTKLFFKDLEELKEAKDYKGEKGLTNYEFRLPTEAEWEYAARGGIYQQGYEYCGSDDLKQVGWSDGNGGGETKPVGLLLPNELGLYDLSGNLYERCEDDWHSDYDSPSRPDDGSTWEDGATAADRADRRVIRGGNSFLNAGYCRPAYRSYGWLDDSNDSIGFRVVLAPVQEEFHP